ncbi:ABC1-domain-containing protein [Conidiobolus coronatus NRRL 28638]|uniref:ABC1-domain-containing protein n=1 Tax=Conidiobolus coronatus (strain ATCC 28846 / CBS 209.66 / NRRL 28638) TaxID=796925 RepID=A0A137PEN8_CONC2|nr:ABC1-domain-containing protein [Conidiobolus coronatus NRRL 28638]|eukprot:KXN73469.1 ABC1-domain-containing protein [Conidiobolus coronatus NRRL 28638]
MKDVKQEVEKEEVTQAIDEFEDKKKPQLTESAVPTTQIGRMYHYGALFGGIGLGVVSEAMKRGLGISKAAEGESLILSEANVNRIAEKLSKMRGAAQKLGQVLSIQDSNVLPPHVEKVLFKVQNAGSCMPQYQLRKVLEKSWGDDWLSKFQSFEFEPVAAASIGQVHRGVLIDGTRVAVKVQYPGVAKSIDSDLKSLSLILTASSILPKGLYLEKSIQAARKELGWETDYLREAHYIKAFNGELANNSDYYTPKLIEELSSDMVLTMEWIPGMPLSEAIHLDQVAKDRIGDLVFKLCLMELFQFKFMQTDPNWTNFLYDPSSEKLGILDFGASRDFDDEFLSNYLKVLICAAKGDREGCLKYSYDLGYLTGDETLAMKEAHVDSIVILAEPFQKPGLYNFTGQTITARVKDKIPLMIQSRLTPPPEQTYSLHRKLSGVFLLCARMNAKVDCHKLFWDAVKEAKVNIKE